jgi:hypothetical protein
MNYLKRISPWSLILCLLFSGGYIKAEEVLKQPSSWKDYLAFRMAKADLGEWRGTGVTTGIWAGIPAGLKYQISESVNLSADRTKFLNSHQFKTESGEILSTGSGFVTYDAGRDKVYSSGTGFDMGTLYTATRRFEGMGKDQEMWTYTETIKDQTYTIRQTIEWVSDHEKWVKHEREGDASSAIVMKLTKVSKDRAKVPTSSLEDFYELCDLLEGRWLRDVILIADWPGVGLKRGEKLTAYDTFSKLLDGELLQWHSVGGEGEFSAFFHWDSASSTIQNTAYHSSGAKHHAVWWKVDDGHYRHKLDASFERDGRKLKGEANFVFDEDNKLIRFLGEGIKLGGEKLDPLRDVFRKISK